MKRLLPTCIVGILLAGSLHAGPADVLTARFKQTNARIDALFSHRTEEAAKAPVALNPFHFGNESGTVAETAPTAGGPTPANVLTDDAEQLKAAVASLKYEGLTIRANQAYVTINGKTYQEGDQVTAVLPSGQFVFLKVLKIVPTVVGQRGTITFGLKDLQIDVSL